MNKTFAILGGLLGAMLLVVVWFAGTWISTNNRMVELETRFEATEQEVRGVFDNVWRIIEGKAGVTAQFRDDFLKVVQAQVEGRKGGDMAKAIQEAAPGLDASLYRDVANAIESQRTVFLNAQVKLKAIEQEHTNLRLKFPSSFFVGGRSPLKYKFITSNKTEDTFRTGQDNSPADPFHNIKK